MSDSTSTTEARPQIDPERLRYLLTGMSAAYVAKEAPDRMAVSTPYGQRTFAELNARANQLVQALRSRGLQVGDAVALLCPNRPEFGEVVAAVFRSGLRLTPINWHLTGEEAGYIVDDCEAVAFIADARFGATAVEAARAGPRARVLLAVGGEIEGFESYEEALATEPGEDIDDPTIGTTMLYTSGTTGRPKGVYRPPGSRPAPATATPATTAGYDGTKHVHLCTGPLYHAAPLLISFITPLAFGVGVVLMDTWDPKEALRLIDEHKVTHTHLVPTMFHRLLALPDDVKQRYDVSSISYVLHGAAPCPVHVKQAMLDWWGPVIHEYYAATEGGGTSISGPDWLKKPGSVGKPGANQGIRVLDDDGNDVTTGEVGTVYMRAPEGGRFEYYKDQEKTAKAYRGDWFTLGDMGYLDDDGYLFLTDRSANLIISGGVNIYPAEVDAVLLTHPAVGDVATIGVPNEEWGEEVKAVVELKEGGEPSEALAAELIAWCHDRLARFKCPRTVDFTDSLPRADTGKIYKRLLRDEYRRRWEEAAGAS